MVGVNSQVDWLALAQKLFDLGGKKTYHIGDLSEIAVRMELVPFGETDVTFAKKLGEFLSKNSLLKTPQFSKVKNKTGGIARGIFRIRPQKAFDLTPKDQPKVSTLFTGAAGEYCVMSEFLFRGYNASKMTVDDGIDLVASKEDKYFHIQVKTANYTNGQPFKATIKERAFRHSSNMFYIIVLREPTAIGFVNRYVVLPSSDIRRFITQAVLKDATTINIQISIENQKYMLNKVVDVSHHVNDFASIC